MMQPVLTVCVLAGALALLAGCPSGSSDPVPAALPAAGGHGGHQAPGGWCGVAVGDHFAHIAVQADAATGRLEVQIFDGHFENAVRIKDASITIRVMLPPGEYVDVVCAAVTDTLSGETAGDSSTFRGEADILKTMQKFDAVFLGATIKGQAMGEVPFPYPAGVALH